MASQASFDVSTGADLQEVDNALNQARKEVGRFHSHGRSHDLLLDVQLGVLDKLAPLVVLGADEGVELLRRAADQLDCLLA